MPETIQITKAQLTQALKEWEQDHRDGKTISDAEAAALTVDQHAADSADSLWERLQQP